MLGKGSLLNFRISQYILPFPPLAIEELQMAGGTNPSAILQASPSFVGRCRKFSIGSIGELAVRFLSDWFSEQFARRVLSCLVTEKSRVVIVLSAFIYFLAPIDSGELCTVNGEEMRLKNKGTPMCVEEVISAAVVVGGGVDDFIDKFIAERNGTNVVKINTYHKNRLVGFESAENAQLFVTTIMQLKQTQLKEKMGHTQHGFVDPVVQRIDSATEKEVRRRRRIKVSKATYTTATHTPMLVLSNKTKTLAPQRTGVRNWKKKNVKACYSAVFK